MTSSKRGSGRRLRKLTQQPSVTRGDGLYAGKISEEREAEIRFQYHQKQWTEIDGLITLGFVSKCGEWFNCYCKQTGHFYSFGTTEALKIKLAEQRKNLSADKTESGP
jgi:hypothetical protein